MYTMRRSYILIPAMKLTETKRNQISYGINLQEVPFQIIAQSKIEVALQGLENDLDLKYASIGFCAIDINSNQVFAQRNSKKALIPASSMKVITTGSALAMLGSNYIFKTYYM